MGASSSVAAFTEVGIPPVPAGLPDGFEDAGAAGYAHFFFAIDGQVVGNHSIAESEDAGVDEDVTTVAVGAVIIANDTVAEDDIYALCFDIFENPAALVENHAKYGEVSIDKGASITAVPYHPGAAKYFEEKGKSVAVK